MPSSPPLTRIIYSRDQLLALEPLAAGITLSVDSAKKFDVIEVGDPVPAFKRRDADRADGAPANSGRNNNNSGEREDRGAHDSSSAQAGSSNYRRGDERRDDRFARSTRGGKDRGGERGSERGYGRGGQAPNDRFFPISRDSREGRGTNRNQETFDEGVKYELERNAEHMRRIQETLQKEHQRGTEDKMQPRASAASGATKTALASCPEDHGHEEIERLLAAVGEESHKTSHRRSRFFDSSNMQSDALARAGSASGPASAGLDSRWKSDPSMWSTAPTAGGVSATGGGAGPSLSAGGMSIGGITIAGGVANLPTAQQLGSQQQQQSLIPPQQQLPQQGQHRGGDAARAWHVNELEQVLKANGGARIPSSGGNAPAKAPVNAADIESMLLQQARGGAPTSQPGTPPQQPQAPGPFSVAPQPFTTSASGTHTPPQQLPPSLQGQPMTMAMQQQWFHQQQLQQPAAGAAPMHAMTGKMPVPQPQVMAGANGITYPMLVNQQGQAIAVTPAQQQQWLQMVQQQQQQAAAAAAAMYRRPDGTPMFLQPTPAAVSSFPTNAQFLYQQQQQLQNQQRR